MRRGPVHAGRRDHPFSEFRASEIAEGRRRSARQLVGKDIDFMNFRRLGEQVRSFRHQGLGDLAIEMGVTAGLARKGVEDPEDIRTHPEREPCRRLRLPVHKRKGADEKVSDLLLLAWLGFELDVEGVFGH
jgi:hypothetical protein